MTARKKSQDTAQDSGNGQEQKPPVTQLGAGYVMGNLCEDPELRFTPTGRAVCKLRVAYSPRYKDEDTGKWADGDPQFYTVNVWGQQGEHCAEALMRGDRIVAAGSWSERTWETREGESRKSVELTAQDIGPSMLFRLAKVQRTKRSTQADFTQPAGPPMADGPSPDDTGDPEDPFTSEPPF